jgi:hypothetical protein
MFQVANDGNTSMQVTEFTVWANWGELPTKANPQPTSTALPITIALGAQEDFVFTVNVPASAAGQPYHLGAKLVAQNQNGTGWAEPTYGVFPGWNFTVLSSPAASSTPSSQVPIYSIIVIALFAVSISLRVFVKRRRRAPPIMPGQ